MPYNEASSNENGAFCLRRIGLPPSLPKIGDIFSLKTGTTVVGRNPATSDIFLDSAVHKALISRLHARITTHPDSHKVTICDTSLNGTYVNDKKILDTEELCPGDIVTFGHLKGAVLEPGTVAKQHNSEFQFKLEHCPSPVNNNNNNSNLAYDASEMQDFLPDLSPFLLSTEEDNSSESQHQTTKHSQADSNINIHSQNIKAGLLQVAGDDDDGDQIYPRVTIRSIPIQYIEDSDTAEDDNVDDDDKDGFQGNSANNESAMDDYDDYVCNGRDDDNSDNEASKSIKPISADELHILETTAKSGWTDSLNSMDTSISTVCNTMSNSMNKCPATYAGNISDYASKINGDTTQKARTLDNCDNIDCNFIQGINKQSRGQNGSSNLNNEITGSIDKQPIINVIDPVDFGDSECDNDELVAYAIAAQNQLDDDLSDSELFCVDIPTQKVDSGSTSNSQTSLSSNGSALQKICQSKSTCSSPSRASFYFREESDVQQGSPLAIDAYNTEGSSLKRTKGGRPPGTKKKQKIPKIKKKQKTPKVPISTETNIPDTCGFHGDCLRPHDRQDYVEWVQCDYCKKWYHLECTGLALDTVNNTAVKFNCGCVYAA